MPVSSSDRSTRIVARSKSTSRQRIARISPRLLPVDNATKTIGYIAAPLRVRSTLPACSALRISTSVAVTFGGSTTDTIGATGSIVGEAAPKPVTRLVTAADPIEPVKASAIICLTSELVRAASGIVGLINRELRSAIVGETDVQFLAGITAGITPSNSAGESSGNFLADLRALLAAVTTSAGSRLFLVMDSTVARLLAAKETADGALAFPTLSVNGGTIAGVTVLVSDNLTSDSSGTQMILVDASQIVGNSDIIVLDSSSVATLQLDDAPGAGGQTRLPFFKRTRSR